MNFTYIYIYTYECVRMRHFKQEFPVVTVKSIIQITCNLPLSVIVITKVAQFLWTMP